MADPNQAQIAALLALLASQQNKGAIIPGSNPLSVPPPSASGSLDLNNLANPPSSSGGIYEAPPPRYGETYSDRKFAQEDDHYRQRDRDDRYPPPRSSGYDDGNRFSRDWERDRDRDYQRDRDRDFERRDQRRQNRYRERSVSPGPRPSAVSRDYEEKMTIETIHVGMVIGRGGDTLRRIERESGARVQFAPESANRPGVRVANIVGSSLQVSAARAAIKVLVESSIASKSGGSRRDHGSAGASSNRSKDANMAHGTNKFTFSVPDKCVGLIIGRGGESINEIQRRSGARVNIVPESQSVNGRRPVNLFGTDEANQRAKELIEVIVQQDESGVKKGQSSNAELNQRSRNYDHSPERNAGQDLEVSKLTVRRPASYSDTQVNQSSQQANPSQYGTYQNPFQYLQTASGSGPTNPDPATAQAWAAYYAQQQQQQKPQAPPPGYPQYGDGGQ